MKFTIIRSKFIEGLKSVQNLVNSKTTLPILQNVKIEAGEKQLFLTTTDLDITVRTVVECETSEPGATTLPAKLLFNTMSCAAEGPVYVEVDEKNMATISAGSAVFKIGGLGVNDFPVTPIGDGNNVYIIPQAVLRDMIRKTSYAVTQDETRKNMRGLLFSFKDGKFTMVGTDARRLAMVQKELEYPADAEMDILLPLKTVGELSRNLVGEEDVKIVIEGTQITFNLGTTQISSKLVDEKYPNYLRVIPEKQENTVELDRQMFMDVITRTSILANSEANIIALSFENNQLTVVGQTAEIGEARDIMPVKYIGESIKILLNPTYLLDCLKSIDDEVIKFEFSFAGGPVVIKCSIPFLCVIMPLRQN